jgi:hypothetical protein
LYNFPIHSDWKPPAAAYIPNTNFKN